MRRPCPTPTWAVARSPTNRPHPSSSPNATAAALAAGSADHFVGDGARQVLDAHPARLADLLMDRRRRHLLRPVAALARAERPSAHSLFVPLTVYRAARRLARTSYRTGLEAAAARLPDANRHTPASTPPPTPRSPRSPGRGPARPHAG